MKDFFKFMFASMLGFIIVLFVAFLIFMAIVASMISFAEKQTVDVKDNTVLKLKLDYPVNDRTLQDPFASFGGGFDMSIKLGLNDILINIDKAKTDDRIKGIYLNLSVIPSGISTIEEIRDAILDFKESGKFVYCYSEGMSQSAYYLATAADKIYLHPDGLIELKGLATEMVFLKGTLEKLDIEIQVMRHGKYKSAVEPLINDKMSDENREQIEALLFSTWKTVSNDIGEGRGIDEAGINNFADKLEAIHANKALEFNIIDGLYHWDEMQAEMKKALALGEDDDVEMLEFSKYDDAKLEKKSKKSSRDKIAIIYAIGSIEGGKGNDQTIGSDRISKAIRNARTNDRVKAVVMRVNSPGGSAMASEVIRREVELTAAVKPFIVSMGDVAASGGYWISCSADKIIADETCITGSIGVIGIIPNMQGFFNNKLGVTFDYAKTNTNADFASISKPLSPYQKQVITMEIEDIYQDFLKLVSEGRNMTIEEVDAVAQGRVWNAVDAKRIGLVDELGGLNDAIAMAAEAAGLEDYKRLELPYQKSFYEQLLEDFTGNANASLLKSALGEDYIYYQHIKHLREADKIQARMPFDVFIY